MTDWVWQVYFLVFVLQQGFGKVWVNFSLTDLNKCKLSHNGAEYKGDIRRTVGGALCQNWNTKNPIHEIRENLTDADFVDGKKSLAKNHCRNPKQEYAAPWCYTLDQDLLDDVCEVPLCSFSDCRLTGPGDEYGGNISETVSGRKCMAWTEKNFRNYEAFTLNKSLPSGNILDIFKSHKKRLPDSLFPDGSRSKADNFCRNPMGDTGGPWCITKLEIASSDRTAYEKSYCSVPFCNESDCSIISAENSSSGQFIHSFWTEISGDAKKTGALEFKVQLWSPAAWKTGALRLALSYLPVPMDGASLRTYSIGLEIVLSNTKAGITPAKNEEPEWVKVGNLISGVRRTSFTLNWMRGSISLNVNDKDESLILRFYNEKNTIMGLLDGPFKYFSVLGTSAFWNIPSCMTYCEQHITSNLDFSRIYGLKKFAASRILSFHVRAKSNVSLEFYLSPSVKFPNIRLELSNSQFPTSLSIQETIKQGRRILKSQTATSEVSYWQWKEFSINIVGQKFTVFIKEELSSVKLLEASDPTISSLDWFSIGSDEVVAHWTLFCSPSELLPIPDAEPPECVMNGAGENYSGTQWITAYGKPCLVWIHDKISSLVNEAAFPEASLITALNYCRNPTNSKQGPYCYILGADGDPTISYCHPRQCRAIECRRSGSGSDYIGSLNVTSSNHTCISPKVNVSFSNGHQSLNQEVTDNFCRNENNDPGGPWCFVSDSKISFDRCNIPDCHKAEQSTIIISDSDVFKKGKFFVAPHWKSEGVQFWLKNWNPNLTTGLSISLFNRSSNIYYKFTIGAEMNRKLILHLYDSEGKETILKEALVPHLIKSGKWTGVWLKLPMNKLEFGLEGITEPLFDFDFNFKPSDNATFLPTYVHFGTFNNSYVGVHFKAKECLTGSTESSASKVLFPMNVWRGKNNTTFSSHGFQFYLRATGITVLEFYRVPSSQYGVMVKLDGPKFEIISNVTKTVLFWHRVPDGFSINLATWSALEIKMKNNVFEATTGNQMLFQWTSPFPLLYYFFSVSNADGKTIWTANCDPPDIDGKPRNGGWGDWGSWDCSVPCGGGQGIRYRQCSRPPPNIFGLGCQGSSFNYGVCNTHKCGTLSEDTLRTIKKYLQKGAFNKKVAVGDPIYLNCEIELVSLIQTEAPEAELEWTLNEVSSIGWKFKVKDLTSSESTALRIDRASLDNTGVYACILNSIDGTKVVIHVTAIVVWSSDFTTSVHETRPLSLVCHSGILSNIFPDLQKQWFLNATRVLDISISSPAQAENDQIASAHSNHSGEWACVVSQIDLGLSWTTAWMRVKGEVCWLVAVLGKPTFWTYLLDKDIRRMVFDYMGKAVATAALAILFVGVTTGLGCSAYYYNKWIKEYHGETK